MKDGAAVNLTLGPDPAAMTLDDPLDDRQADPRALKLGLRVQTLEDAKELVSVPHVEAGSIVRHTVDALIPLD